MPGVTALSAVTLATADMAAATTFYDALGFEKIYGGPQAGFTSYRAGESYLNLIAAEPGLGPRSGAGMDSGAAPSSTSTMSTPSMQEQSTPDSNQSSNQKTPPGENATSTSSIQTATNSHSPSHCWKAEPSLTARQLFRSPLQGELPKAEGVPRTPRRRDPLRHSVTPPPARGRKDRCPARYRGLEGLHYSPTSSDRPAVRPPSRTNSEPVL